MHGLWAGSSGISGLGRQSPGVSTGWSWELGKQAGGTKYTTTKTIESNGKPLYVLCKTWDIPYSCSLTFNIYEIKLNGKKIL